MVFIKSTYAKTFSNKGRFHILKGSVKSFLLKLFKKNENKLGQA